MNDLAAALASAELASFFVAQVDVTPDYSFVELAPADITHGAQGLCMCVIFDEAESTWCPTRTEVQMKGIRNGAERERESGYIPAVTVQTHDDAFNAAALFLVRAFTEQFVYLLFCRVERQVPHLLLFFFFTYRSVIVAMKVIEERIPTYNVADFFSKSRWAARSTCGPQLPLSNI